MNEEFRDISAKFLLAITGPFVPASAALISFGSMSASFQDFAEFMQSLGGEPHPQYVEHSKLSPAQVSNIVNFSKSNPVMHGLMLNTAPHYAALYNMAKLDEEIQRLPDSAGNRMKVDDAIKFMGGLPGYAAFKAPQHAVGLAQHAIGQVGNLADDFMSNWLPAIKATLQAVEDILKAIQDLTPYIKEYVGLFRELAPALLEIKNIVVVPYLDACRDALQHIGDLKESLEKERKSVDSATPPIVPDNFDAKRMAGLAMGYNLPVLGAIFKGQLNAELLEQYMAMHKRGVYSDLDFHRIAANGMPNPLQSVADVPDRIPRWFISK